MGNSYSDEFMENYVSEQIKKNKKNPKRSFLNIQEAFHFQPPNKISINS